MSIIIYGFAQSTFVRTARLVAAEKGLAHTLEGFDFGSDEHRALHPFAKMPAARIEGELIFESPAIARQMEQIAPEPVMFPDGAAGIRNEIWASTAADYLYHGLVLTLLGGAGGNDRSVRWALQPREQDRRLLPVQGASRSGP